MARWISRPERALCSMGTGLALLAAAELATLMAVSGRDRLIVAGALVGACLSLVLIALGIVRTRRTVDTIDDPSRTSPPASPQLSAALLEGFPMDQLRPALLADPERLRLEMLYTAWRCALLGRDTAWIEARFAVDPHVAKTLVRAARATSAS